MTLGLCAQRDVAEALALQLALPLVDADRLSRVPDPRGARVGALPARGARAAGARGRDRGRARDGRSHRRLHDRRVRDGHRPRGAADGRDPDRARGGARAPVRHRQVGAEPADRRRRDARRRARVRRRRPAAEGPRVRGAGHPARVAAHHQRARHARVRHPRRAVREPADRALPHRRRAARGRVAAAAPVGRGDLAHQDHGEPRHRRAPPAAGRPHPAARPGQGDRPARLHRADDARRIGRDADPRQGRRRARLRPSSASRTTR